MTMYYARGSAFAKGLIDTDKTHFAKEWVETQGLSSTLRTPSRCCSLTSGCLAGMQRGRQPCRAGVARVGYSREQREDVREGELAYRETVLGGCASVEPCKSTPLDWMRLDCIESNCQNLVVVPSKLQRVIKAQQVTVAKLRAIDKASVEYRIEAQTLKRLLDEEKSIKPEAA